MKAFSISAILVIFFTNFALAQYDRGQGVIFAEGQQFLTLERQAELLNEMPEGDQWEVFLSLSMGCYVVSEMALQMEGFGEDYWGQIMLNSMQGVVEVFKEAGVTEEKLKDAFDHFFDLQYEIYKKTQSSENFSKFFVDEMGFCSKFFGTAGQN